PPRDARATVASAAERRREERRPHFPEQVEIALLLAVALHVLRAALDEEAHPRRDALAALRRLLQHARVHVHVFLLARRARARIRDVDAHPLGLADVPPVP